MDLKTYRYIYIMPQTDNEKRREYNKKYYLKNKCEHNRQKNRCKDCGGSSLCEHSRRKTECKDCGGSSICEHKRQKSQCKDCGGCSICEHNRYKNQCKECGGSSLCEHSRRKTECKDCGGSSICEHNRVKFRCKDCGGSSICEHNREKYRCKDCGGRSICEHNQVIYNCKECLLFPQYLVKLQRKNMNRILHHSNIKKTKSSVEYLGCDALYFKEFIEKKMVEGMTWNNIHLDHIKPVSKFDLNNHDDFLDCCHYTNFQPLYVVDNLEKSNKWTDENNTFWNDNIRGKEYLPLYF
jgi:hypothetical protein